MDREKLCRLLRLGIEKGASDIHFQVGNLPLYRFNGNLVELRYKVLAPEDTEAIVRMFLEGDPRGDSMDWNELDLAYELPGEGRFRVNIARQRRFFNIVLRVIPLQVKSFDELNLPSVLREIATLRRGYVLVTGATGMGKSTTLATMINEINRTRKAKIITIEDPIEFVFTHEKSIITQREVGTDTESFPSALRAALRQDPDVIMVGEIRDRETAEIAIQASLTGHLVFSTLHTNDAPGAVTRLADLGVPRYLLSAALTLVIAQRLVRRVCPSCAEPTRPTDEQIAAFNLSAADVAGETFHTGRGCDHCDETGYKGRLGTHELMSADGRVGEQLVAGGNTLAIRRAALAGGMRSLREDALIKARRGSTSLAEVLRVTPHDTADDEGSCPTCGQHVDPDFDHCPWCAADLRAAQCGNCGRELHYGWQVCPRCATRTPTAVESARSERSV